ncbi:MAG TPA: phosphatidylglycerol lysyltransferase domain-containing protein [Acidimicrobiales bacterium]|nr:phosphatidylglycerol lysyltransferase domain-containing protein [Acidimicrobiales bacterium]
MAGRSAEPRLPKALAAVLAGAFALLGAADLASAAGSRTGHWEVLAGLWQPHLDPGSDALIGVALVVIARGLLLRRHNAYRVGLAYLAGMTVVVTVWVRAPRHVIGLAVLAACLYLARQAFPVPGSPRLTPSLTRVLLVAAAADAVCGTLVMAMARGGPHPYKHPLAAGRVMLDGFVGRRVTMADPYSAHWALPLLTAVGCVTVVVLLAAVIAPPAVPLDGTRSRAGLVRALADRIEGSTLDPFALRHDKLHLIDPVSGSAIGYRPMFGVALASGPPVGPPGAAFSALSHYLQHCQAHGWRPAIIGLGPPELEACDRLGLRHLHIGDEAVIDVGTFNLATPAMRNVRQAVKRTRNFGVTTSVQRESDLTGRLREQLLSIAFVGRGRAPERGFSMTLGDPLSGRHGDSVVVVAFDSEGEPVGFQRYAPCRGGRALSLDIMRRVPAAPNGVNERMIADVVAWAAERQVDQISLNFAAFRDLMDLGSERNRLQRIQYWLVHRIDRWIKIESLYRFNAKFHPVWLPRYVAYRSPLDLGWVLLAALTAEFSLPIERFSGAAYGTDALAASLAQG